MYEFTVAKSHILRNPKLAFFTIAAVTLAVAVIVVFMGLLGGFEEEIITTTVENNPHIYVQPKSDEKYIYLYRTISAHLWDYPGVEAVSARLMGKAAARYKDKVRGVEFLGVDPADEDRLMKAAEDIVIGNFQDLQSRKFSAFMGTKLAEELKLQPEDDFILARGNISMRLRVAGLFETGSAKDKSLVYIPLTTAQDLVGKGDVVSEVDVRIRDIYQAPYIVSDLNSIFRYQSKSWQDMNADILKLIQTQSVFSWIFYILIFVIAGFGIANTMIMIISRRTKEIGIRKAIGARRMDILWQFLIESVVMSVSGGLIGIMVGVLAAFLLSTYGNLTPVVSANSIMMSFAFASVVGIFFGIYPAWKAAMSNVIDALRYE
jgi:lipoprotein-releasing system permease protein